MAKRPKKERRPITCPSGKHGYQTDTIARKVATKSFYRGAPHLRVYFCLHCSRWHLTRMLLEDSP